MKKEYYLPFAVREQMASGACTVRVYSSEDAWYGVTYLNDKDAVYQGIRDLQKKGIYPAVLNG